MLLKKATREHATTCITGSFIFSSIKLHFVVVVYVLFFQQRNIGIAIKSLNVTTRKQDNSIPFRQSVVLYTHLA